MVLMNEKFLQLDASNISQIEDYTQSANSLFHFMRKQCYLESALKRKSLFPRYCKENIQYLELTLGEHTFNEIAVLQKCFCDIPLHLLVKNFSPSDVFDEQQDFTDEEKREYIRGNNHTGFYGEFALAFSKQWCESNNLQPINYLNSNSSYTKNFRKLLNKLLNNNEIAEYYVDDILQRLSLIKPLRGEMPRVLECTNKEIKRLKNYHDEQEWRYIPDTETVNQFNKDNSHDIKTIIANPKILGRSTYPGEREIDTLSNTLQNDEYSKLWLKFSYSDIRYIIVPDDQSRLDIIKSIMSLPTNSFESEDDNKVLNDKYILLSKILVLSEIRKDW